MKKFLIVFSLITLALLTSCTRKVRWVEMNIGDIFKASYQYFNSREVEFIKLDSGETLYLSYNVVVEEGSLTLQWESPDEYLIWEETFNKNEQGTFEFTSETNGRHCLIIIGDETQGEFDLSWEIAE